MDHITADRYIVADIIRDICGGVYRYGDKLPTIYELCKKYNFAPTTVKKALRKLGAYGFTIGETSRGTKVVFDCCNPSHVAWLKEFASHRPVDDLSHVEIPAILYGCIFEAGLDGADEATACRFLLQIECILERIKGELPFTSQIFDLVNDIAAVTNNPYVYDINQELQRQLVIFVPPEKVESGVVPELLRLSLSFFNAIKSRLTTGAGDISSVARAYYSGMHRLPGVVVVPVANQNDMIFGHESQYRRIAYAVWSDIITGRVKSGEFFPPPFQMSAMYDVARRTVDKAYGMLSKAGLIKVIPYIGAQVVVDWGSDSVQKMIKETYSLIAKEYRCYEEVFEMFAYDVFSVATAVVTPAMCEQMERDLDEAWESSQALNGLMLLTRALMAPMMQSIGGLGRSLYNDLLSRPILCFSGIASAFLREEADLRLSVYESCRQAVRSLKLGDEQEFMRHFQSAASYNKQMFRSILADMLSSPDVYRGIFSA